jgi:ABC-2 type transport system ATP-binding protein
MSIILLKDVSKHFKVLNRHEGILGTFKDLFSRDYRIIRAVDCISLEVGPGEILGFIGPNGAGKSTTIKMLCGVLEPTAGRVVVDGFVPFRQRKKYVQHIGVVLGQRSQLWWDLPVIESLKILKAIYRIDDSTYRDNIGLFNDLLDLRKLYAIPVRKLSLGQRMLCDIAASFLHDPKIIFLDEPSIGLDISVKATVRKIIGELNTIKKTTIVITSHDLGDIETLCRRIILIDKGKLLYDGGIGKFNTIFGRFRTLKMNMREIREHQDAAVEQKIKEHFRITEGLIVQKRESGWLDITINEDRLKLFEVLRFLMKEFAVKDIKVEEITMENVVKKVYEGALQ